MRSGSAIESPWSKVWKPNAKTSRPRGQHRGKDFGHQGDDADGRDPLSLSFFATWVEEKEAFRAMLTNDTT